MKKTRKNPDNPIVRWPMAIYQVYSRSIVLETKEDMGKGKNFNRCTVGVLMGYIQ